MEELITLRKIIESQQDAIDIMKDMLVNRDAMIKLLESEVAYYQSVKLELQSELITQKSFRF